MTTIIQADRAVAERFNVDLRAGLTGTQLHNLAGVLAAHREASIAPLVEAATRFDRFFSKALEWFTEGWAERQTPSHVAFAWNGAHLTVGDFLALRAALQSLGENGK